MRTVQVHDDALSFLRYLAFFLCFHIFLCIPWERREWHLIVNNVKPVEYEYNTYCIFIFNHMLVNIPRA